MRIVPVPCLRDNYAYLVIDEDAGTSAVVDPSEADPVVDALAREGVTPTQLWITHHHWDHTGGIPALVEKWPDLEVLGSVYDQENDRIPKQTRALADGDTFPWAGHEVAIQEIPGHTLGAIAFVVDGNLFSGDTLFLAGCGRVFEGTMEMMSQSLAKLRDLPGDTRVWCGHEYTVNNLRFAQTVEPDSAAIREALAEAEATRQRDEPTVPGPLSRELETNPFLRFDVPEVAGELDPVASFTKIRAAKDEF